MTCVVYDGYTLVADSFQQGGGGSISKYTGKTGLIIDSKGNKYYHACSGSGRVCQHLINYLIESDIQKLKNYVKSKKVKLSEGEVYSLVLIPRGIGNLTQVVLNEKGVTLQKKGTPFVLGLEAETDIFVSYYKASGKQHYAEDVVECMIEVYKASTEVLVRPPINIMKIH